MNSNGLPSSFFALWYVLSHFKFPKILCLVITLANLTPIGLITFFRPLSLVFEIVDVFLLFPHRLGPF